MPPKAPTTQRLPDAEIKRVRSLAMALLKDHGQRDLYRVDQLISPVVNGVKSEDALVAEFVRTYGIPTDVVEAALTKHGRPGAPVPSSSPSASAPAAAAAAASPASPSSLTARFPRDPTGGIQLTSEVAMLIATHTGGEGPVKDYPSELQTKLRLRLEVFYGVYNPQEAAEKTAKALEMKVREVALFSKLASLYPESQAVFEIKGQAIAAAAATASMSRETASVIATPSGGSGPVKDYPPDLQAKLRRRLEAFYGAYNPQEAAEKTEKALGMKVSEDALFGKLASLYPESQPVFAGTVGERAANEPAAASPGPAPVAAASPAAAASPSSSQSALDATSQVDPETARTISTHTGGSGPVKDYPPDLQAKLRRRLEAFYGIAFPSEAAEKAENALGMKVSEEALFSKLGSLYPQMASVGATASPAAAASEPSSPVNANARAAPPPAAAPVGPDAGMPQDIAVIIATPSGGSGPVKDYPPDLQAKVRRRLEAFYGAYNPQEAAEKTEKALGMKVSEEALFGKLASLYPESQPVFAGAPANGTGASSPPPSTAAAPPPQAAAPAAAQPSSADGPVLSDSVAYMIATHTGGTGPLNEYPPDARMKLETRLRAFYGVYNPDEAVAKTEKALGLKATEDALFAKLASLYPEAVDVLNRTGPYASPRSRVASTADGMRATPLAGGGSPAAEVPPAPAAAGPTMVRDSDDVAAIIATPSGGSGPVREYPPDLQARLRRRLEAFYGVYNPQEAAEKTEKALGMKVSEEALFGKLASLYPESQPVFAGGPIDAAPGAPPPSTTAAPHDTARMGGSPAAAPPAAASPGPSPTAAAAAAADTARPHVDPEVARLIATPSGGAGPVREYPPDLQARLRRRLEAFYGAYNPQEAAEKTEKALGMKVSEEALFTKLASLYPESQPVFAGATGYTVAESQPPAAVGPSPSAQPSTVTAPVGSSPSQQESAATMMATPTGGAGPVREYPPDLQAKLRRRLEAFYGAYNPQEAAEKTEKALGMKVSEEALFTKLASLYPESQAVLGLSSRSATDDSVAEFHPPPPGPAPQPSAPAPAAGGVAGLTRDAAVAIATPTGGSGAVRAYPPDLQARLRRRLDAFYGAYNPQEAAEKTEKALGMKVSEEALFTKLASLYPESQPVFAGHLPPAEELPAPSPAPASAAVAPSSAPASQPTGAARDTTPTPQPAPVPAPAPAPVTRLEAAPTAAADVPQSATPTSRMPPAGAAVQPPQASTTPPDQPAPPTGTPAPPTELPATGELPQTLAFTFADDVPQVRILLDLPQLRQRPVRAALYTDRMSFVECLVEDARDFCAGYFAGSSVSLDHQALEDSQRSSAVYPFFQSADGNDFVGLQLPMVFAFKTHGSAHNARSRLVETLRDPGASISMMLPRSRRRLTTLGGVPADLPHGFLAISPEALTAMEKLGVESRAIASEANDGGAGPSASTLMVQPVTPPPPPKVADVVSDADRVAANASIPAATPLPSADRRIASAVPGSDPGTSAAGDSGWPTPGSTRRGAGDSPAAASVGASPIPSSSAGTGDSPAAATPGGRPQQQRPAGRSRVVSIPTRDPAPNVSVPVPTAAAAAVDPSSPSPRGSIDEAMAQLMASPPRGTTTAAGTTAGSPASTSVPVRQLLPEGGRTPVAAAAGSGAQTTSATVGLAERAAFEREQERLRARTRELEEMERRVAARLSDVTAREAEHTRQVSAWRDGGEAPPPRGSARDGGGDDGLESRLAEVHAREAAVRNREADLKTSEEALHRHWSEATDRATALDELAGRLQQRETALDEESAEYQRETTRLRAELSAARAGRASAGEQAFRATPASPIGGSFDKAHEAYVQDLERQLAAANSAVDVLRREAASTSSRSPARSARMALESSHLDADRQQIAERQRLLAEHETAFEARRREFDEYVRERETDFAQRDMQLRRREHDAALGATTSRPATAAPSSPSSAFTHGATAAAMAQRVSATTDAPDVLLPNEPAGGRPPTSPRGAAARPLGERVATSPFYAADVRARAAALRHETDATLNSSRSGFVADDEAMQPNHGPYGYGGSPRGSQASPRHGDERALPRRATTAARTTREDEVAAMMQRLRERETVLRNVQNSTGLVGSRYQRDPSPGREYSTMASMAAGIAGAQSTSSPTTRRALSYA